MHPRQRYPEAHTQSLIRMHAREVERGKDREKKGERQRREEKESVEMREVAWRRVEIVTRIAKRGKRDNRIA